MRFATKFALVFLFAAIANAAYQNLGGFWKGVGASLPQWTWMTGVKNIRDEPGIYGTKGVASTSNTPGYRYNSMTWRDSSNNLWLYGGVGIDSNLDFGQMGDLWKYNPATAEWTWVYGESTINTAVNYGTRGVSAPSNTPGGRSRAFTWSDTTGGIFWLFGGNPSGGGTSNDLWKYTISTGEWTWVNGDPGDGGVSGTLGVPDVNNYPSARQVGVSWMDSSGNLWLYGGSVFNFFRNDVWRYRPATNDWTWMKGDASWSGVPVATYGTKGTEAAGNTPSGRDQVAGWVDGSDNLWFFGGYGLDANGDEGAMNDVWRFNTTNSQWTWMSGSNLRNQTATPGTKNVPSTSNVIGARNAHTLWKDTSGNAIIFGGYGYGITCQDTLNDLWKYNPTNNEITWIGGPNDCGDYGGTPGTKGTGSTSNLPSIIYGTATWQDASNNFYMFGGSGYDSLVTVGRSNALWRYNATTGAWTWLTGSTVNPVNSGVYGTKGTPSATVDPGARFSASLTTDNNGYLWLFGGRIEHYYQGNYAPTYGSLMRYNPTTGQWTWIAGNSGVAGTSVFGTKGVGSTSNVPEPLANHRAVKDNSGNIWIFGGMPRSESYSLAGSSNLWKFNPTNNEWTWVHGPGSSYDEFGVYNVKGVSSPTSIPGARQDFAMAADSIGNLWVFGGYGMGESGSIGNLNDLWKFNIASGEWTWMAGGKTAGELNGVYGTKGVANGANTPGARYDATGWTDDANNFYIFAGIGRDSVSSVESVLSELWKFDGTNWTWIHGANTFNGMDVAAVYGSPGVFATANIPGGRVSHRGFQELGGYFWLYGGWVTDSTGSTYRAGHDIWKYDPIANQWACVFSCDDSNFSEYPVFGTKGTAAPTNRPGNGLASSVTIDRKGVIWIFGTDYSDGYGGGGVLWRYQ